MRYALTGVDFNALNYATKYTTKMKTKFSYFNQIKLNEAVLKSEIPELQHIVNHYR